MSAIRRTSTISLVSLFIEIQNYADCISELFLDGLQELGIPILTDPNNGTAAGAMLIPDSINPEN